jgi:hypothetical protein
MVLLEKYNFFCKFRCLRISVGTYCGEENVGENILSHRGDKEHIWGRGKHPPHIPHVPVISLNLGE